MLRAQETFTKLGVHLGVLSKGRASLPVFIATRSGGGGYCLATGLYGIAVVVLALRQSVCLCVCVSVCLKCPAQAKPLNPDIMC